MAKEGTVGVRLASPVVRNVNAANDERQARLESVQVEPMANSEWKACRSIQKRHLGLAGGLALTINSLERLTRSVQGRGSKDAREELLPDSRLG